MWKTCKSCGETKALELFPVSRKTTKNTYYRALCSICTRLYRQENYKNNEKLRVSKQKYEQKRWQKTKNDEEQYKKYLESKKAHKKTHYLNNKVEICIKTLQRKAKILQATPPWADLEKIRARYEEAVRGNPDVEQEVDHIVPLVNDKVCGLHVHYNLRVIPKTENRSKHNHFNPAIYPEQGRCASYEDTI